MNSGTARAVMLLGGVWTCVTAGASVPSKPVAVEGFAFVKSMGGIDEYRLSANGLSVLLSRDASAPVVTFDVTYRVGSRNEVTGTTGSTHLLEHLMFKGSKNYNDPAGNSVKQYLERVGGGFNATTSLDRTNYYATVGRDNVAGYVAIEADRMRNLWLHESDRRSEMTVVRNEFERGKNDPVTVLVEDVTAAAYQALPYHHPTIGWRSDIENVPIEKLREFYDTFYWPNNATVIVAGDFEPAAMLGLIRQYYGPIPSSPKLIPQIYTEEPEQSGPRRVTVKRPGELGTVVIGHKVPNALSADQAPLAVLDSILSGGKNGRLYRGLVDKGLALYAGSGTNVSHDMSLHFLYASMTANAKHADVEKALLAEVDSIKSNGVSAAEVDRVKRQTRAEEAYKRDGTAGVVGQLNECVADGDWTLYVRFVDEIQGVTPSDVQRVAKTYLDEDQSTTGWYIPTGPNSNSAAAPAHGAK